MMFDNNPPGATPIDANLAFDLKQPQIRTQSELNEAEQANIAESRVWSRTRKHSNLISEAFIRELHRRMYGNVWRWAGKFRTIDLANEAFVVRWQVRSELRQLIEDTKFALTNSAPRNTSEWDEFAVRFHHRLVKIHAFNNGNGRHAREMTDLILLQNGQTPFTWGSQSLREPSLTRTRYVEVLQAADHGDLSILRVFVRS